MQNLLTPRWIEFLEKILSFVGCSIPVGFVCFVAFVSQAGVDSGGPMNMNFGGLLLWFFAFVSLFTSHLLLRFTSGLIALRTGGLVLIAITVWWSFWLPSSFLDVAYSLRYHIPDPYVFAASPDIPVITMLLAGFWLTLEKANGVLAWIGHRITAFGLLLVCLYIELDWVKVPMGELSPKMLWWSLLVLVVSSSLWVFLRKQHRHWAALMLVIALQAVVVGLWDGVYFYSDRLPAAVNHFGCELMYSGSC